MKILMVCLGNICRSPLAEGIMQDLSDKNHLGWEIDSAGTGNWHVGQGPDRRSTRVADVRGVPIGHQKCRQFRLSDFEDFDHIYVMDRNNLADVLAMAPNKQAAGKVKLLLGNKEVPDPYYDDTQFAPVFDLIEDGCKKIVKELHDDR
ncbi:low molecular weight protein-tyrosine-phosphatase [Mucilaginibacter sp. L196]|uniref:low molecular weight protein-tyrosine-phosphatase n=1 Tax=Mucilaginibacter sp. L196 TaxID=1641870 RepID=UPI00131ECD15|nr:low molecular weight protein-tyrosine-phosphatase [Mucilaginibacter sp. L196]